MDRPTSALKAPDVLAAVRDAIVEASGSSLVGLYLHGSLVAGGFDEDLSDIDLVAVLSDDPSDELIGRWEVMHESLARQLNRPGFIGDCLVRV